MRNRNFLLIFLILIGLKSKSESVILDKNEDLVINFIATQRKIDKNKILINQKAEININENSIQDLVFVVEIEYSSYTGRLLVLLKDGKTVEIFDKILPFEKLGLKNNIILDTKKNDLSILIELSISRPVSYDYLSFSTKDEKLILDTLSSFFRDYNNFDKSTPFTTRGEFLDKSDFGNINITELSILDKEDNFYTDLSSFKFENLSFKDAQTKFNKLITIVTLNNKNPVWIRKNLNIKILHQQVIQFPVYSKNVNDYNNLGYYLEQAGAYNEATFILQKVVQKFPDRTVAYINLGDAYFGLKNSSKAKEAYNKYITLMKKSGKESKIPKRVFERVK